MKKVFKKTKINLFDKGKFFEQMNIVCSTFIFNSYPLEEAIKKIATFGFKKVELCVNPLHSNPNRWKKQPEEIKLLVKRLGLEVNSIHVPLLAEISDSYTRKIRDISTNLTKECIDLAAFFGSSFIVQHVRVIERPEESGQNITLEETLPDLNEMAFYAERKKIKLAIENVPSKTERMLGKTIEEVINIVDILPEESAGLCLDLTHCLVCGYDPVKALRSINSKRLLSIHASDNFTKQLRDVHLPLGSGDIPWKRVIDILKAKGFQGSFVIEVAEQEDGNKALMSSLEFLRKINSFLKFHNGVFIVDS
jgi:sugar phosphate isomerase/epimerase